MVLFKDDPNLKKKKIKTKSGVIEYVKNCKKIDGEYHIINRECISIGGKWYSLSNPCVLRDFETGEYFLDTLRGRRMWGVVDIVNDRPVYGFFTPQLAKNVKFIDDSQLAMVTAIGDGIFKKSQNFIENLSEGVWYRYDAITSDIVKKNTSIVNVYDWTVKKYNIEDNANELGHKTRTYNEYPHPINSAHEAYGKYLKYSFGYEFEVNQGFVPDYLQYRHGIVICRDGSINGGMEAVTIPLAGVKGFCSLAELCEAQKNRVTLDIHCSTHLHLGGYSQEKYKIIALYLLCLRIQSEIFQMLPPYKKHWEGFKKKNYCKELDGLGIIRPITTDKMSFDKYIERAYGQIFSFLADFKQEIHNHMNGDKHPSGDKWNIENRKTWANFINMFFSNRKTIEFRALQATFNPVKVVNWLFICNAILMYADAYTNDILTTNRKISLNEILNIYSKTYPEDKDAEFLSHYLIQYVNSRKSEFADSFKKKDFACQWDLDGDSKYDFRVGNKNLLM